MALVRSMLPLILCAGRLEERAQVSPKTRDPATPDPKVNLAASVLRTRYARSIPKCAVLLSSERHDGTDRAGAYVVCSCGVCCRRTLSSRAPSSPALLSRYLAPLCFLSLARSFACSGLLGILPLALSLSCSLAHQHSRSISLSVFVRAAQCPALISAHDRGTWRYQAAGTHKPRTRTRQPRPSPGLSPAISYS